MQSGSTHYFHCPFRGDNFKFVYYHPVSFKGEREPAYAAGLALGTRQGRAREKMIRTGPGSPGFVGF
jgi:hypothetical protein